MNGYAKRISAIIILLFALAVLTAACVRYSAQPAVVPVQNPVSPGPQPGTQQESTPPAPAPVEQPGTQEPAPPEPQPVDMTQQIPKEEYDKANSTILNNKYVLSTGFKRVHVGDQYVFAIGIHNIDDKGDRFRPVIEVDRVDTIQAGSANPTTFNQETMKQWFDDGNPGEITVAKNTYQIIPLVIKIKDLKGPSDPTVPGSYYFVLRFEYYDNSEQRWLEYYEFARKTFSLKVE